MNQQVLIAVIDSANARFLTLEEMPSAGLTLTAQESLTLPAAEAAGADLWSSTKTGRNRGPAGQAHSYDDHRQEHEIEFERHFAHSIVNYINQLLQERDLAAVLLVAAPQVLGVMRPVLASDLPQTVKVTEVAKDLCHFTTHEIQEYLAEQDLIPAPTRLGI